MRPGNHLVAIVLWAAGCSSSTTNGPAPSSDPPPPPASAPAPVPGPAPAPPASSSPDEPTADAVIGRWSSPSCGERKYERRIELLKDGTFQTEDRVSPCPPQAKCVWSGIVLRQGTWKMADGAIALTAAPPSGPAAGQALPATLSVDKTTGVPAEGACIYQRPM